MGSLLIEAGLPAGASPEAWNLERPEILREIHRAYFEAGADVVQTNTFGGNRIRLAHSKCPYTVEQACEAAAKLALEVRPEGGRVAGDIGPTGLSFPPLGTAVEDELRELFAQQARALAEAGVDLISIETMSDLREARAALNGVRDVCGLPVAVSMTFRSTKRGFFTIMGDPAETALKSLLDEGADGVGANCTLSSEAMAKLALELRDGIPGWLLVQPNAGEPALVKHGESHRVVYPEEPEPYAARFVEVMRLGIDAVGGCCGTTPEHIRALCGVRERING